MLERLGFISAESVVDHIGEQRECLQYRPTAVFVAHTAGNEPQFLLGRSSKYRGAMPWLLQGGIEPNETIEEGVVRELSEEVQLDGEPLDISPDLVSILGGLTYNIPRSRDGYTKGKLLIACGVPLPSLSIGDEYQPNTDEVASLAGYDLGALRLQMAMNAIGVPRTWRKALFTSNMASELSRQRLANI